MRRDRKKTTLRLTLSAVAVALGVILLWLGAMVQVLDLSMAVIVSLLAVFGVIELKSYYPYLIYAATSILSLLLLPVKTTALIYVLFAGYYPILKAVLEGHLPRLPCWIVKIAVFCAGAAGILLISEKVLLLDLSWIWAHWYLLLVLIPIFVLYDVVLTRLITSYLNRWRARLRIPDL